MTTTPVTLLSKRSGNASDRPVVTTVQNGELAINFAAADNGLYFKDSVGAIRKITGTHYGSTAPNSSPAGQAGNSVGETWVESAGSYYMRVWTGSSWQKVGAGFADTANTATSASTATSADQCTGKVCTTFTGGLPAVGVAGSLAFNTSSKILYASDGTAWNAI